MFTRILFLIVLLSISISSLFAAIRLPWGIDEAIDTGFIAPKSGSKDVITPEGCRTISGVGVTKDYFVPTKTTTEWDAFKANIPTGIAIGSCGVPTYTWRTGYNVSTHTCDGNEYRSVWCQRSDGEIVSQLYCNPATKPSTYVGPTSSCKIDNFSGGGYSLAFCTNSIISLDHGWYGFFRNSTTVGGLSGGYSCANAGTYKSTAWQQSADLTSYGTTVTVLRSIGGSMGPSTPFDPAYTTGANCYSVNYSKCITYNADPISNPPAVTGSCGSANATNTLVSPVSNLCTKGYASIVTASGANWIWSCYGTHGGGNNNCSALNAPPSIPGVCGSAGGTCVTGGVTADSGPVSGMANYRTWTCLGQYGGADSSCSSCYPDKTATYQGCTISGVNDIYNKRSYGSTIQTGSWMFGAGSPRCFEPAFSCAYGVPPVPVNGVCGATPATCSVGAMTSDNGQTACSTTRTWTCAGANGGTNASCNKVNPVCPPTTYNETNVMRMGDAETNSLEWSINLRTGVANYWSGFRWGNPFKFTLLSGFTPQSVATMASYSKVAVSIEREGRPGSWNGRRWWHLPYQVQAPTALNDWTTIWRVDRKGGGSTDGQWSMKMTTLTGPYEYMFVSVYKHSEPVMLDPFTLAPISFDPTAVTNKNKVQALGSTTVAQVNYNTTTPEWSKTYAPLSDCVVPSTLDPNGFCPSGWAPTKTVPSSSVCGGATGNGKTEDTTFPYITFEPKLIMTQICRR